MQTWICGRNTDNVFMVCSVKINKKIQWKSSGIRTFNMKIRKCRFFASAPPSSPFSFFLKIIHLYLAEEINICRRFQSLIGPQGRNIIKHWWEIEGLQFRIETMRVSADEGTTTFLRWLQAKENIFVFNWTKWKLNVCSCGSHWWLKDPTMFLKLSLKCTATSHRGNYLVPGRDSDPEQEWAGEWNDGCQIRGI